MKKFLFGLLGLAAAGAGIAVAVRNKDKLPEKLKPAAEFVEDAANAVALNVRHGVEAVKEEVERHKELAGVEFE